MMITGLDSNFARYFIGNSVSSFSASLVLERRRRNLWAASYNEGVIPLSRFVPGFQLPWVFAVHGDGDDDTLKLLAFALSRHQLVPLLSL